MNELGCDRYKPKRMPTHLFSMDDEKCLGNKRLPFNNCLCRKKNFLMHALIIRRRCKIVNFKSDSINVGKGD